MAGLEMAVKAVALLYSFDYKSCRVHTWLGSKGLHNIDQDRAHALPF